MNWLSVMKCVVNLHKQKRFPQTTFTIFKLDTGSFFLESVSTILLGVEKTASNTFISFRLRLQGHGHSKAITNAELVQQPSIQYICRHGFK